MIGLTLAEVAEAVSGHLVAADPATVVTGPVEYDSRLVAPGGLFVAFPGEQVDGHDYAAAAHAAGAVAVLATRVPPPGATAIPTVLVDDQLTAMPGLTSKSGGVICFRPLPSSLTTERCPMPFSSKVGTYTARTHRRPIVA